MSGSSLGKRLTTLEVENAPPMAPPPWIIGEPGETADEAQGRYEQELGEAVGDGDNVIIWTIEECPKCAA
jgi:hypothetical protein